MSVTVYPDTTAFPRVWGVTCYAGEERMVGSVNSYEAALEVRSIHMAECSECAAYGCFTTSREVGVEVPEVNMSNFNARDVFGALGFVGDDVYCGSITVEALDSRVQVALAVGTAGDALPVVQDGNAVFCGREEGYIAARLERIAEVIAFAREHGVEVVWG